jgi:uncharacterized protein
MPTLLIDGYNLLYAAGILARGVGPGSLQRARLALLNFLAESLDPAEAPRTTVVFDAHDAPWGAANRVEHRGMTVLFAARYPDADGLIEELIVRDSAPRQLTVVSGDHRLQRAARRRKALAVDSEAWYQQLLQKRRNRREAANDRPERPAVPLLAEDVDYWVRQFGGEAVLEEWTQEEAAKGNRPAVGRGSDLKENLFKDDQPLDSANPFPPGYGEDVEDIDS